MLKLSPNKDSSFSREIYMAYYENNDNKIKIYIKGEIIMKKTIIATIIVTMMTTVLGCYGVIRNINQKHEEELNNLTVEYQSAIDDISEDYRELTIENNKLENKVCRFMDGYENDLYVTLANGQVRHYR